MTNTDIVVYTACFGGYDLPIPPRASEAVRYVAFTDDPDLALEAPWERVVIEGSGSPQRDARRVKVLPHEYLPEATIWIWVDANVEMTITPSEILSRTLESDSEAPPLWAFRHPERDCVYDEGAACVDLAKDDADTIYRQLAHYHRAGYPTKNDLAATAVVVRANTEEVRRFNEAWWAEMEAGSHRDQLSFDYAAWQLDMDYGRIPLPHPFEPDSPFVLWPHGVWGSTVDVIIPTVNAGTDMLQRCLDSIERNTLLPHYNVVIGDNSEENLGFAGRVNACIRATDGEFVMLLNDDTVVPRGWLRNLVHVLRREEEVACVGPLSTAPSQPHQWVHSVAARIGHNLPANGYMTHDSLGLEMLSFWCTLFPRAKFDELGLLDEDFFIYGEDDDWCRRAKAAGYKLALDLSTVVRHDHRQSYGPLQREHHRKARAILERKWGVQRDAKVLLAVLNTGTVRQELSAHLLAWMQELPQGVAAVQVYYPNSRPIQDNRNRIAKRVLAEDWDYVFMVDADVIPQRNPLELVALGKDVVGLPCQVYSRKRLPAPPVYWNVMDWHPEEGVWYPKDLSSRQGLIEADAVGSGATLVHRRVFEHPDMRAPFNRVFDADGLAVRGLDYEFCRRAREAGFGVWAHLDYYCEHMVTRNAGPTLEEANIIYEDRMQAQEHAAPEAPVDGNGRRVRRRGQGHRSQGRRSPAGERA